jgi:Trypsin-co-occurring domain 1
MAVADGSAVERVRLPDGTLVWARVGDAGSLGRGSGGGFSDTGMGERAVAAVEGLSDLVRGVAGSLRQATSAVTPDEVCVEFGIDLTAKPGKVVGLLADGEATAAIKVTLTWRKDEAPQGDGVAPLGGGNLGGGA